MKSIDQLIEEKRAQLAKLQAQLEVLDELAGEAGGRGRAAMRQSVQRPRGAGRGRGRGGRGQNQQRVLAVLRDAPQRARDIAAAAKLTPAAVSQVLMVLTKRGSVTRAGRGLYKLADKTTATGRTAPKGRTTGRPRRRKKGSRRPRKAAASKAKGASKESSAGREEATSSATKE